MCVCGLEGWEKRYRRGNGYIGVVYKRGGSNFLHTVISLGLTLTVEFQKSISNA